MNVSEEMLVAYVDDELDAERRAEIERALADDPDLRARVDAHRALRTQLSAAFDGALSEPVPERLVAAARAQPTGAQVIDFAEARQKWSAREWGGMAASLAAGVLLSFGLMTRDPSLIETQPGGLFARGALEQTLNQALASDEQGALRVGLSFRNTDGRYCRTFTDADRDLAGLACREPRGWRVAMAVGHDPQSRGVRMAGAETPPALLAAVEAMIEGDALGAEEEARARAAGWRLP